MMSRRSAPQSTGGPQASFTLVELLVVMAIVATLAAITLVAAQAVLGKASRDRAQTEIVAMSSALESYKSDNGAFPVGAPSPKTSSQLLGPPNGDYPKDPSVQGGNYQLASQALFQALSGKINYLDTTTSKTYFPFQTRQLGNYKTTANSGYTANAATYVSDPYGFAYGYSTGDDQNPQQQYPYAGSGFFDLWSTGGLINATKAGQDATNSWIVNWK